MRRKVTGTLILRKKSAHYITIAALIRFINNYRAHKKSESVAGSDRRAQTKFANSSTQNILIITAKRSNLVILYTRAAIGDITGDPRPTYICYQVIKKFDSQNAQTTNRVCQTAGAMTPSD